MGNVIPEIKDIAFPALRELYLSKRLENQTETTSKASRP
jgi:hypothetical protein